MTAQTQRVIQSVRYYASRGLCLEASWQNNKRITFWKSIRAAGYQTEHEGNLTAPFELNVTQIRALHPYITWTVIFQWLEWRKEKRRQKRYDGDSRKMALHVRTTSSEEMQAEQQGEGSLRIFRKNRRRAEKSHKGIVQASPSGQQILAVTKKTKFS